MSEQVATQEYTSRVDGYVEMNIGNRFYGWLFLRNAKTDLFSPISPLTPELLIKAKESRDVNCSK